MTTRALTIGVLATRIAYGAALLAAPARVAGNRWLGEGARSPAAEVALRGLGAREIALHGAALAAAMRGSPLRPFLLASIAGDLADIGAATVSRDGLPNGSAPATAAVAGGSALVTALVAVLQDEGEIGGRRHQLSDPVRSSYEAALAALEASP